jgi:hypothetical protein
MNAQTVQNITTISEFIHSAGMAIDSKELKTHVLLDGAKRPCSTLYRPPLNCNRQKNFARDRCATTRNVWLIVNACATAQLARCHRYDQDLFAQP